MQLSHLKQALVLSVFVTAVLTILISPIHLLLFLLPLGILPHGALWLAAKRFPPRSRANIVFRLATVLVTLVNAAFYGFPLFEAFSNNVTPSQVYAIVLILIPVMQLLCFPMVWYIAKFCARFDACSKQ